MVETEHLFLRELEESDATFLMELDRDLEKIKYFPPPEESQSIDFQTHNIRRNQVYYQAFPGLGIWAAIEKEHGAFAGWFALKHLGKFKDIEIAYCIVEKFRRKHFATDMAKKLIDHGLNELGLERILGVVSEENVASRKILEHIGMTFDEKKMYNGNELLFYSISS